MKIRILTIGSSSMITSVILGGFPNPGQAVTADKYAMRPGGHGLLTAIAISKLGGDSIFAAQSARTDMPELFGISAAAMVLIQDL